MLKFTFTAKMHEYTGELTIEHQTLTGILAQLGEIERAGIKPLVTEWSRTPEGDPICPKHGAVMPRREKQGDIWHSHKIIDKRTGEELYCRGYSSPSSPGFDVPPDQAQSFDIEEEPMNWNSPAQRLQHHQTNQAQARLPRHDRRR